MKNILRLFTGGLVTVSFALAAQAANLAPGAYSAGTVKGDVSYKVAGSSEYKPLAAGVALPQGATIKTGAKSNVLIVFGSGSTALIDESSEVEITKFEQEVFSGPVPVDAEPSVSVTEIKVIEGDIVSKVNKLKKGSSYVVDTPVGAAGVRGTVFRVSFRKGNTTFTVQVSEGAVVFKSKTSAGGGNETLVEAGKKVEAEITQDANGNVTGVQVDVKSLTPEEQTALVNTLRGAAAGTANVQLQNDTIVITPVDTTQVGVSTN